MAVPLIDENSELLGFMAVISPYSNYKWTEEDEEYLNASSASLAAVIKKAQGTSQNKFMLEDLNSQLESKLGENKTLVEKNDQLAQELAGLEDQINNMASINTEKNILIEEKINLENEISILEEKVIQNEEQREQHNISEETVVSVSVMASETIAELETENKKLKLSLDKSIEAQSNSDNSITELTENHKTELHEAIERIEDLQNKLESNKELLEINLTKIEDGVGISPEQADVIASIAQELRQPMSSISGYTDLLLGESVGILGALQRKFLDRVKNSTDRMNNLINDLLQITALESGNIALSQNAIELTEVVDEIISMTSGQLREKNIALRVNLPSKLPQINSDKDAVQQILIHLLQNAGDASPEEGEIFLKAKTHEEDNDNEYIQIEITDTGEGIPQEDIPRVFSRLYRADNPLIQGVGDTGVGLSIAKTLTEALGGRIWVESEIQKGSTFSVILPLSPPSQNGDS